MRALHRLEHHRHFVEAVEFAVERQLVGGEAFEQNLERLVVHRAGLRKVERIVRGLERRHAAADAELEPPAAQLIEHADFFDQPQRMIERQQIHQRAEAQLLGALRQRGKENSRRSRAADRRAVMLGEVIAVKARAVISLGKPQPAGKQLGMRDAGIVHVVENTEFHDGRRTTEDGRRMTDTVSFLSVLCRPSSVLCYFHSSLTIS